MQSRRFRGDFDRRHKQLNKKLGLPKVPLLLLREVFYDKNQ